MKRTELILKEAFKRVGYDVELKAYPSARSIVFSNQGVLDGEAQRIYEMNEVFDYKLPNLIRVPEPHQALTLSAFVYDRDDIILDPENPYETIGKYNTLFKIGIVTTEMSIKKHALTKIHRVPAYDQMFKMLAAGRADILIGFPEQLDGNGLLTRGIFKNMKFKVLHPPVNTIPLYLYLHKKHKELVQPLAVALKAMKADGSFDKIVNK